MFCDKCGSILTPKKNGNKKVLFCQRCGFEEEIEGEVIKETLKHENLINVFEDVPENMPETDQKCPKCGHDRAYFTLVQTRSADEPETQFYKCVKCSHVWRVYD